MNLSQDDILENERLSDRTDYVVGSGGGVSQSYLGDNIDRPIQDILSTNDGTSVR